MSPDLSHLIFVLILSLCLGMAYGIGLLEDLAQRKEEKEERARREQQRQRFARGRAGLIHHPRTAATSRRYVNGSPVQEGRQRL